MSISPNKLLLMRGLCHCCLLSLCHRCCCLLLHRRSDIQYADIPDGQSFHGVPRFYRNSVVATKRAMLEGWVPASVDFGIHVGDVLDGFQPKVGCMGGLQTVSRQAVVGGTRKHD